MVGLWLTKFIWSNIFKPMKYLSTFFTAYLLLLFSCSTSTDPNTGKKRTVDEDALLNRLSADLITNARTQAAKDQNIIASYCIDHMLDMKRTASGLYYQIIEEGVGATPTPNSKVSAHYKGSLLDGTVFDSSYKRGQPLNFQLGQVIKGWQEGLQMLRPGGKGVFLIPSGLAYGTRGFGKLIPPNTVLLFEVELIK